MLDSMDLRNSFLLQHGNILALKHSYRIFQANIFFVERVHSGRKKLGVMVMAATRPDYLSSRREPIYAWAGDKSRQSRLQA